MNNRNPKDDRKNGQMPNEGWENIPCYQMYGGAFYEQDYSQPPPGYQNMQKPQGPNNN